MKKKAMAEDRIVVSSDPDRRHWIGVCLWCTDAGPAGASRKRQRCAAAGRRNRNDMAAAERIFHRGG